MITNVERMQFTFYRSYYEAIRALPKKDQTAVLLAVCAYALDNKEPNLSGTAKAVFTLIRPTLDTSRRKSQSGKKGGENGSKTEASGKQNGSKTEAKRKQTVSEKEVEKEEEKEVEIENECYIAQAQKNTRHKYGSYSNVLLTDEELGKLKTEFPADWEQRIERLSEYIASKGTKYKNHLATIRAWARKEGDKQYSRTETKPSWMKSKAMPGSAGAPLAGDVDKYMHWDDPAPEVQREAEEMQRRMQAKYGKKTEE